jgi:transcriptional regulator with XRE-family HTH domain
MQMRKSESSPEIGERLKNIRIELRLQQKEIAETLQIAPSYLCEIEAGRANPGPEFFKRLAAAYNVNLQYVFLGSGGGEMFSGPGGILKPLEFKKGTEIETIEELNWLMEHSVYFRNTILAFANKTINKEEDEIMESLQRNKSKTGTKKK